MGERGGLLAYPRHKLVECEADNSTQPCVILVNMSAGSWREILRETPVADGLEELFDELERCGWKARSRVGEHGIRFWPNEGRSMQTVIDTRYPLNEHKLQNYRQHTGLELEITIDEGGNR